MQTHDYIGYTGILLIAIAYAPTLYHLIAKKCAFNICMRRQIIWLFASVMLAIYAFFLPSIVFIIATLLQAFGSSAVIFYAFKHRQNRCDEHRH